MNWISFSASIIATIGALWIALGDRKDTKGSKIVAALVAIAAITTLIAGFQSSRDREQFERDLRLRSEETLNQLTGGDGFAEVNVSNLSLGNNIAWLIIKNPSNYPLYDISLVIVDNEMMRDLKNKGVSMQESFFKSLRNLGPFNIGPSQVQLIKNWRVNSKDKLNYAINATARNGSWFQSLRYKYNGKKWVEASQVKKDNKIVLENIDMEYPKDADGKPIW